jgi:PKD repeat protein
MEKIYNQFSNKVILKNLLNFCFLAFLIIGFSSSKIFAQCGPTTYSISISTASYLDETVCQIRNAAGTVVHSFGPNATSSSYVASGTSPNNGPFTFWVGTTGTYNDNTPTWTITASGGGGTVLTGSIGGGSALSSRGSFCALNSTILTSGTLSPFTSCAGTASSEQSFSISGTGLTANISITPPTGYEVSTTSGSGFNSSVTLTPSLGTVSATTIYARLTNSASGTPSGNITCTSTGATTKNVTASGTVNALPTVSTTNPTAVCSPSTIDLTTPAVTAGSTGGLTYTYWTNNIATSSYATPAAAANGAYFIKGTDANSCFAISGVTATVNTSPTVSITNPSAVCSPSTIDLTASAVTAGSTGGLTYTYWTNNIATNSYATPAAAANGAYFIKGTDANGCYAISSVSATVNPLASITNTNKAAYNGLDLTCNGTSDGQITVTASGGTGTLQYSKDNGSNFQLSNVFSGLSANTYQIKVKDVNTCTTTATTASVDAPVVVSFSTSKTSYNGVDLSCHNGANGQITVTPSGGSGTYSYSKNNGSTWQVSNVFSGLSAGNYLIKVKDANNCSPSAQSVTINNPTVLSLGTISNNGTICENFALTLASSATGGTGSYSYAWSGPLSYTSSLQNPTVSSNATSAMSGTYNIVITDVNGCSVNSSTNATVNEMPHLVSNASPVTNTICEGTSTTITCTNAGSGAGSPSYTGLYSNNFNTAIGTGWTFPATVPVTATPAIKSWNGGSVLGNMGAQQAILNLTNIPSHDFITVDYDLYIHDSWDGNNTNSGPDVFNMIVNGDTSIHTTFSNWNFSPYNTQAYPNNIPASNPNFTGALATNLPTACNSSVSTLSAKYHISKTIAHTAASLTLLLEAVGTEIACNESWSIDNLVIQRRTPAPSSNILWSTTQVASAITVSPTDTTTYTASNGTCSNSITIHVNPTPRANFDIDDAGQCILTNNFNLTNTSSLAGPGGFTSSWTCTGSNTPTATSTNLTNLNYASPGTKNVNLVVTSNIGNCSTSSLSLASINKQLDITDTVFVRASNSNPICQGSSVSISATQNGVLSGSGPAVYSSIYSNNFNTSADTANWTFPATMPVTSTPSIKSWNGQSVLGFMGAQQAILNLSGLATHDSIKIDYDLYIHDSWDGNTLEAGPDIFNMKVDGSSIIQTTFANWNYAPYNTQAYPGNIPSSNPYFTGAVETQLPRACSGPLSTKYHISKIIAHTSSSLSLLLEAVGIEVACNESWSIDSLSIQIGSTSGVVTNSGAVQWSNGSTSTNSTIVVTPGLGNTTYTATIGHCSTDYTVTVVPVPTPAFTYDNANCNKTVNFTNDNVEASVSYSWNFGDGSPIYNGTTATNHTYTNGTYTITLTATLPSGCTRQTTRTVTIADQPTASFTSSTSTSCTNGVFFTNTSTLGSGNSAAYLWNFGDVTTSTSENPTKTYASASSYNVSLTVTTGTTCISAVSQTVNAPAGIAAATANFTAAVTTACGNKVTTNNLTTGAGNQYLWNFDDGSTSNDFEPTHYYLNGGTRTISLTVINAQGCTSTYNQQVSISANSGNTARLGLDFTISPNDTQVLSTNKFSFAPVFTNMPNNNPPIYANGAPTWSFGDASNSTNTNIYNKVYTATGNYTVKITQLATNTGCYAEASKVVTVIPTPIYAAHQGINRDLNASVVSATTGIDAVSNTSAQFNLYPNPNNGNFKVMLNNVNVKNAEVSVLDMLGREVYNNSYRLSGSSDELEITNLNVKSGSYNIIISSDGAVIGRKAFIMVAN